jgi:amidophosphoribosyltransferase
VGLIKNKYIGRTFIQPVQSMREESVRIKLNALAANVRGKSVVLIDDSIVRGTTSKRIVDLLKKAGAKQVHFRVSSPPILYSCFFGIDTPSRKNLIASSQSVEEIRQHIGADTLKYLSFEGMKESVFDFDKGFCTGCFDGNYPMEIPQRLESEQ